MDNIESQIEDVSSDLKENKREQDETQKSLKQIESSIQKLSSDQAVVESLQGNRELKEKELAEVQEKNNELVNRITDIISTIKEEQASDGQSYCQLEGLESIGEDVSDAIAVLDEKNEFYEKCLETLSDLLDSNQILEKELREKMGLGETNSSSSEKQDYSRNDEDVLKSSNSINFDAEPGNYTYIETPTGKKAFGIVKVGPQSKRDAKAQVQAGGEDRRPDDQGGHLIAYILGGVTSDVNLDAQNCNVNQRDMRRVESYVMKLASDPNNIVYYEVENFHSITSRPEAVMIHIGVKNKTTGEISHDYYEFTNESHKDREEWEKIASEYM
mgnify:FL=1